MTMTCFLCDEIDPFQRDRFQTCAVAWGRIIPRCGGHLVGDALPHDGSTVEAWGLIAFDALAADEAERQRLRADAEGRENFAWAQRERFILKEGRRFTEVGDSTFQRSALAPA